MREEGNLDRLIDQALSTYADADSGLERRVLARIAGERTPVPQIGRLVWIGTLAAVACLLPVFALVHRGPARAPVADVRNAPALPQTPLVSEAPTLPRASQQRHEVTHHKPNARAAGNFASVRLPKQEVFPMPRPLSREERALVEFAAKASESERKSLIERQQHMDEPIQLAKIRIDDLNIQPLESPQAGTN